MKTVTIDGVKLTEAQVMKAVKALKDQVLGQEIDCGGGAMVKIVESGSHRTQIDIGISGYAPNKAHFTKAAVTKLIDTLIKARAEKWGK